MGFGLTDQAEARAAIPRL